MGIFSFIASQVLGHVSQILKQGEMITGMVTDPLKGIVNNVTGGAWKGDGANRFANEMTSDVLPMLAQIFIAHSSFAAGIKKSHDRMQGAIQQATNQANTLNDVFNSIF